MTHTTEQIIDLVKSSSEEIHHNIRKNLESIPVEQKDAWMMGWKLAHSQLKSIFLAEDELNKNQTIITPWKTSKS